MGKKVFFRVDASVQIGYGHFIRTLALADILKVEFDCTFFTQAPNDFQKEEVRKVCNLVELPADDSKFEVFLNYLTGDEIVFLDNYFYTSDYEKSVKDKGCKLISIGTNDRHYYADAVINYTKLRPADFSAEPYTQFYIGLDWAILRKPFYQEHQEEKEGIVICIGGTDQYSYSEQFYDSIKRVYPHYLVKIIATDRIGVQRIESFKQKRVDLLLNQTAEQMANLFSKTAIAVVSASGVALEALSQGAEVIAGTYVDNQANIYQALNEDGYIWAIGCFNDPDINERLLACIDTIEKGGHKKKFAAYNTINKYKNLFSSLCK